MKGDVDGSVEALSDSLLKLSTEEIQLNIKHKAVGQISESDILLDDITVSRHHAVIEKKDSEYIIKDLESLNGTYINGNIVNEKELSNGDRIQIGKYIFLFFISN